MIATMKCYMGNKQKQTVNFAFTSIHCLMDFFFFCCSCCLLCFWWVGGGGVGGGVKGGGELLGGTMIFWQPFRMVPLSPLVFTLQLCFCKATLLAVFSSQ